MSSQQHYRSIFKSTSLIGGSALINILIGVVRTKFVAVLLGPAGVGLMGMLTSVLEPISTVAGMGIATSGVRQIAEAHGKQDTQRISEVASIVRRTVWGTGILGCLLTVALSPWLSEWTFKSRAYAVPIAVLGVTILLGNLSIGRVCIIQGTRRIADIAKMTIWGALAGTLISIPCYYVWGMHGIVISLCLCSVASLAISWSYARKVPLQPIRVSMPLLKAEVKRLLGFGLPIMASGFVLSVNAYFLRLIVIKQFDLVGVGIWGAAFMISGVLVNFVLNAMGTDYYPRLTGVIGDRAQVQREVNAQTEIALLLAVPALLVTILFAPLGVQLLYSGKFNDAIPVLRWSVYGILGRVISWPLGFILLAQGRGKLFFCLELFTGLLYLGLMWGCGQRWGLTGTGIAFMLLYVIYTGMMIGVAKVIANVYWSRCTLGLIVAVCGVLAAAGGVHLLIQQIWGYYVVSGIMTVVVSWVFLLKLSEKTGITLHDLRRRIMG